MIKTSKSMMMDELVKAVPDIYKDVELGKLMLRYGRAREKSGKKADSQYFKWLYKQYGISCFKIEGR